MGDFGPLGRIRSSLMGDGPQGRGPRSEGIFGSQGRIGYGPRSWRILVLWGGFGPRSRGMALRGGPLPI